MNPLYTLNLNALWVTGLQWEYRCKCTQSALRTDSDLICQTTFAGGQECIGITLEKQLHLHSTNNNYVG